MKPIIELKQVDKVFEEPPRALVLSEVDLVVFEDDYVVVVGPSGSGKSTLLNILGLLDVPTRGSYLFQGVDVSGLSERQRTSIRGRRIGFVFQDFHLLPYRTAMENVAMGLLYTGVRARQRTALAEDVLELVGLGHRVNSLTSTMSGGERQRVAVARALIGDPVVLLCDEPTGNLDSETTYSLLDLFDVLHDRGVTIVTITHDPVTADRASRRLSIRDGRLHEERSAETPPGSGS